MWLAVDFNGSEYTYTEEPVRTGSIFEGDDDAQFVELPEGTIYKLLGRYLTWLDEPIEYEGK